ncbi:hypothetical protein BOX15_Mlig020985g1 [Macrostomum lignano]|uniref:Uncharacterized protein n=2 Tax=Macrostomum lignano TaxID=282301 RepID=A0A267GAH8_9PLAT|nr:hypothetical protein BOX15_Mlig020985g1 [Macrostomum lignano]
MYAATLVTERASDAASPATDALKELVGDCTCPICQEVYTNPHQLACGHTFCLKCFDKLKRKWEKRTTNGGGGGGGGGSGSDGEMLSLGQMLLQFSSSVAGRSGDSDPLQCPVCRTSVDPHRPLKPDQTVRSLLHTLKTVKAGCCQESDCWNKRQVCCTQCACGLCAEHHKAKMESIRSGCDELAQEAEKFLLAKSEEFEKMQSQLTDAETKLEELQQAMLKSQQERFSMCSDQLAAVRQRTEQEQNERTNIGAELNEEAKKLRQLLENETGHIGPEVLNQRDQLKENLQSINSKYPSSCLQVGFDNDKMTTEQDTVLQAVSVRILKRPYAERSEKFKPMVIKKTKRGEPWEVRLLQDDKLLVNYKGFPTRRLHIFNAGTLKETDMIELQLNQGQFPGQICVCRQREKILASDPKNHCVYEFNYGGRMTGQFGSKGSEPGQLHTPKGMYIYENILYVVDSKNKRIQLFDMEQDYKNVGSVEHDSISTSIQAVFVGPASIVICDRGSDSLIVFDRVSKRYLKKLPAGGEPFDACTDRFDNMIVSLTRERKIRIYDSTVTHCINTFDIGSAIDSDSEKLQNYLHGVAFDPNSDRLFVAEAFAKRLLRFDMT